MIPPIGYMTLGYGAGLWTGLVVLVPPAVFWCAAVGMVALVRWRPWWGALAGAWFVGAVAGSVVAERAATECRVRWTAGQKSALVRVHDAPGPRGTTTATVIQAAERCGGTLRLRMQGVVARSGSVVLAVGQYYASGVLRVTHLRALEHRPSARFRIRDAIARRVRSLYGDRAGVVEALVLGRRFDIEPALRNDFADGGIAHLLAISGLHVGIVAAWLVVVLRWCGIRRHAWSASAALTWGYVALLGFPTPATRAAGFVSVFAVARVRQRHPSPHAVLAVALLVVLQLNPAAAAEVGAWLSVAAVLGTSWGSRLLTARWRRRPVARLAASSFGAVLFTAPITAFAFGSVAPIGLLSNLVAIPLAAVAVPGVLASLVIGDVLAGGSGIALALLERVAQLAARVPGGHLTGAPGWTFALPWFAVALGTVWLCRAGHEWRWRGRRILAATAVTSWLLVAATGWDEADRDGMVALHVLNVGQGDAIVVRTAGGRWLVIDAGPRSGAYDAGHRVVVPFLRRQGARRLALGAVTHGDADHVGGVPAVLRAFETALVVEPGQPLASQLYRDYLAGVDAEGIPWLPARAGDTIVVDSLVLAVLHPTAEWIERQLVPNENSLVIHLRYGCFDALLAGDVGRSVERALLETVTGADLLKVGHHGSAGGTTDEWLRAVGARVAVISVGRNRYGHPAPDVVDRLRARGVDIWRTDRDGTVTIETDGSYFSILHTGLRTLGGRLGCRIRQSLRSNGSSSSRNDCSPRPRVTSPACSTTSR